MNSNPPSAYLKELQKYYEDLNEAIDHAKKTFETANSKVYSPSELLDELANTAKEYVDKGQELNDQAWITAINKGMRKVNMTMAVDKRLYSLGGMPTPPNESAIATGENEKVIELLKKTDSAQKVLEKFMKQETELRTRILEEFNQLKHLSEAWIDLIKNPYLFSADSQQKLNRELISEAFSNTDLKTKKMIQQSTNYNFNPAPRVDEAELKQQEINRQRQAEEAAAHQKEYEAYRERQEAERQEKMREFKKREAELNTEAQDFWSKFPKIYENIQAMNDIGSKEEKKKKLISEIFIMADYLKNEHDQNKMPADKTIGLKESMIRLLKEVSDVSAKKHNDVSMPKKMMRAFIGRHKRSKIETIATAILATIDPKLVSEANKNTAHQSQTNKPMKEEKASFRKKP